MSVDGRWQKEPCSECGIDGYSSRSEPREPDAGPYICEGCDMYARGYQEGLKHGYEDGHRAARQSTATQETYGLLLRRDVRKMKLTNLLGVEWHMKLVDEMQEDLVAYQEAQRTNDRAAVEKLGMEVLEKLAKISDSQNSYYKSMNEFVRELLFNNVLE